jgi:hypothetical protein
VVDRHQEEHSHGAAPPVPSIGVVIFSPDGTLVDVNAAAERILRRPRDVIVSDGLFDPHGKLALEDGTAVEPGAWSGPRLLADAEHGRQRRLSITCEDGDVIWLSMDPAKLSSGGLALTLEDISERRRGVDILAARARIVELATTGSLEEVLRATLDELEPLTGSTVGFYHFVDQNEEQITLQAWSTRTERDFCHMRGHGMHYPVTEAGVWADALRCRRPVIHNDYPSLLHRRGLPDGHAEILREIDSTTSRRRSVSRISRGMSPRESGRSSRSTRATRGSERCCERRWTGCGSWVGTAASSR